MQYDKKSWDVLQALQRELEDEVAALGGRQRLPKGYSAITAELEALWAADEEAE